MIDRLVTAAIVLFLFGPTALGANPVDQSGARFKSLEEAASFFRGTARAAAIIEKCAKGKSDEVDFAAALLGGMFGVLFSDNSQAKSAALERINLEVEVAQLDVKKNFSCKSDWKAEVERARQTLHTVMGQSEDPEVSRLRQRKDELLAK